MNIALQGLGKRYVREWIFRKLSHDLAPGNRVAVVGPNGSGKSTFLQVVAGVIPANEGQITYTLNQKTLDVGQWYKHLALASPYMQLPEEMTPTELLKLHFSLKPLRADLANENLLQLLYLEQAAHKPVKFFSSGMKQRLKLGLCLFTQCPLLLLDEPTTNLDTRGTDWYLEQVQALPEQVIVLVASNQAHEYAFCTQSIDIGHFKPAHKKA